VQYKTVIYSRTYVADDCAVVQSVSELDTRRLLCFNMHIGYRTAYKW